MKVIINLAVDAGNISLLDSAYITEHGGDVANEAGVRIILPVTPGRYSVSLSARRTWSGSQQAVAEIDVKGSALVLGDACYSWSNTSHKAWGSFLDHTQYLKTLDGRGACMDTGGDGNFVIVARIKRIA